MLALAALMAFAAEGEPRFITQSCDLDLSRQIQVAVSQIMGNDPDGRWARELAALQMRYDAEKDVCSFTAVRRRAADGSVVFHADLASYQAGTVAHESKIGHPDGTTTTITDGRGHHRIERTNGFSSTAGNDGASHVAMLDRYFKPASGDVLIYIDRLYTNGAHMRVFSRTGGTPRIQAATRAAQLRAAQEEARAREAVEKLRLEEENRRAEERRRQDLSASGEGSSAGDRDKPGGVSGEVIGLKDQMTVE